MTTADGSETETELDALIDTLYAEAATNRPTETTPEIGIIMGSDSDLDVMAGSETGRPGAYDALTELGFAEQTSYENPPDARFTFELYVVSAHRTPELMDAYAKTAADRGVDVIIAGAGGKSADLPNMTAALAYPLPVIGVPVQEKSLQSVIGMPQGSPILAVDAGKSYNAALSAVQILARQHEELHDRLVNTHERLKEEVARTSRQLHEQGLKQFRDER